MWLPTTAHILRLHEMLIERTGGLQGVRDIGLIESALHRASAAYRDYERYPSVEDKASVVCCGLIGNHGFVDGNKRIGIAAMLLILEKNGVPMNYTQQDLIDLGLAIAQDHMQDISEWIVEHKI